MDLVTLCGKPELALHLVCDDTVLMERIMTRGVLSTYNSNTNNDNSTKSNAKNHTDGTSPEGDDSNNNHNNDTSLRREDDNFYSALKRLRTFHEFHNVTLEWLRGQHVPIINLDCSGNHESVWQQLVAIGRLMRPAVKLNNELLTLSSNGKDKEDDKDWSNDPNRSLAAPTKVK
jgi:adenylate kinase